MNSLTKGQPCLGYYENKLIVVVVKGTEFWHCSNNLHFTKYYAPLNFSMVSQQGILKGEVSLYY